jgi:ankyrin repeat protein
VEQASYKGLTALLQAAKNGHLGIVRLLLDARASFRVQDHYANTALHHACKSDFEGVVHFLLYDAQRRNALIDVQNKVRPPKLARAVFVFPPV